MAGRKHFHAFGIYGKGNSRLPTAQSSSSSHWPGPLPPQSTDADERRKLIDGKDAARSSRTGNRLRHGGSLGYKKDKYQVSVACGERALLPEVRKASVSTIIVADGFSCKEQIARETNRHALHLTEVLRLGLGDEEKPLPTMYPESYFVQPRKDAQKKSMVRAAVISGLALATLSLMWLKSRKR